MNHRKIEEVLLDDSFYAWYLHTDEQQVRIWNDWRTEREENRVLLEESVRVLKSLIATQDEEGFPKHIHAVHTRMKRVLAQSHKRKTSLPGLPPNKAMIADSGLFDCCLS